MQHGFHLAVPTVYVGPNTIYSISLPASGGASLSVYNTNANPSSVYPTLPPGIVQTTVRAQPFFSVTVIGGVGGAVVPAGINTNETVYWIRHAEAHPDDNWDDGNFVAAGQWRALDLPYALKGKIHPTQVWSIDGAQVIPGTSDMAGREYWSYIRTDLTVEPYAIANNLPYNLAAGFDMAAQNPPQLSTQASDFFFAGGRFSGQKILVGWEHEHIPTHGQRAACKLLSKWRRDFGTHRVAEYRLRHGMDSDHRCQGQRHRGRQHISRGRFEANAKNRTVVLKCGSSR